MYSIGCNNDNEFICSTLDCQTKPSHKILLSYLLSSRSRRPFQFVTRPNKHILMVCFVLKMVVGPRCDWRSGGPISGRVRSLISCQSAYRRATEIRRPRAGSICPDVMGSLSTSVVHHCHHDEWCSPSYTIVRFKFIWQHGDPVYAVLFL